MTAKHLLWTRNTTAIGIGPEPRGRVRGVGSTESGSWGGVEEKLKIDQGSVFSFFRVVLGFLRGPKNLGLM
jgi:hypothetical protein